MYHIRKFNAAKKRERGSFGDGAILESGTLENGFPPRNEVFFPLIMCPRNSLLTRVSHKQRTNKLGKKLLIVRD